MSPLVIRACACNGPDAPIVRDSDGLHCLECGADQAALIAYHNGLQVLRDMPIRELVAEIDRQMLAPDLGLSPQICPRCSTPEQEVIGEYSRRERRFVCSSCHLILPGSTYEWELENFFAHRWRAMNDLYELRTLEVSSS